ncbi:hypothetical protein DEO72_LG4g944 [Vigna unguiculata]|uniref:Uncharacterized protein n=1 Tax=Vigna unguiculata TaxID=3917 RepID=A0A4D6LMF4_VIGUN|nr:hypothetical protein DEO72_LG4g944 [Vigna unguiculata]
MAAAAAPPHLAGHHCITITPLPATHQQRQHHRNSTVPSPFTLHTIEPAPFPTTAAAPSFRAPPAVRNRSESRKLRRTTICANQRRHAATTMPLHLLHGSSEREHLPATTTTSLAKPEERKSSTTMASAPDLRRPLAPSSSSSLQFRQLPRAPPTQQPWQQKTQICTATIFSWNQRSIRVAPSPPLAKVHHHSINLTDQYTQQQRKRFMIHHRAFAGEEDLTGKCETVVVTTGGRRSKP